MNFPLEFRKSKLGILNYNAKDTPFDELLQYERILRKTEEAWQCKNWSPGEGVTLALLCSRVLAGISYKRRVTPFGLELVFSELAILPYFPELGSAVVAASLRAEEIRSEYEPVSATVLIDTRQDGQFCEHHAHAYAHNGLKPHRLVYGIYDDTPAGLIMSATAEEIRVAQSVFATEWAA